MKKIKIVVLTVLSGMLLFGCGNKSVTSNFSPTQSSVFVTREGQVSSALVEAYEKDYYDQAELKAMIEEEVAAYNAERGNDVVELTSCTMGNGKAIAVFNYASGADLCEFAKEMNDTDNQVERLEVSTVSEGLVAGGVSDGTWLTAKDGKGVSLDTITKQGDLRLLTVDGAVTLQTEGKIEYYSGSITMVDDFTVTSTGGKTYVVFK